MADVFLSYASEDRERVIPLVDALHAQNFTVWWDREIGIGASYDRVIERQLNDALCVIVVWSKRAIESDWVKNEAQEGYNRGVLVPVRIDDVQPPLAFRRLQTADLAGGVTSLAMAGVLASVLALTGRAGGPQMSTASPPGRDYRRYLLPGAGVVVMLAAVVALTLIFQTGPDDQVPADLSLAIEPFVAVDSAEAGRWAATATADLRGAFSGTVVRLVSGDDPAVRPEFRLAGTVRAEDDELVVSVELTATRGAEVLWATTLNPTRKVRWRSGFPQAELIALMVERTVQAARYRRSVLADGEVDPEAVDAYFDAITEFNQIDFRLGGNWRVAVGHLERFIELKPDASSAYGRLIGAYTARLGDSISAAEARAEVEPYLAKMHELGSPDEVAFWQGLVDLHLELNYAAAEANFDSLMNSEPTLEIQRCWLQCIRGDIGQAIRHCDTAVSASPEPQALQVQGMMLLFAGRFADARRALTRSLESGGVASQSVVSVLKVYAEVFDGDLPSARNTLDGAWARYGDEDPSLFIAPYKLLGDTTRAEQLLKDALVRDRNGTRQLVSVSSIFRGLYQLGRLDEAFEYLDRAIDNRDGLLICALRSDPTLQPLRDDPRFAPALSRIEAIGHGTPESN